MLKIKNWDDLLTFVYLFFLTKYMLSRTFHPSSRVKPKHNFWIFFGWDSTTWSLDFLTWWFRSLHSLVTSHFRPKSNTKPEALGRQKISQGNDELRKIGQFTKTKVIIAFGHDNILYRTIRSLLLLIWIFVYEMNSNPCLWVLRQCKIMIWKIQPHCPFLEKAENSNIIEWIFFYFWEKCRFS